MASFIKLSSAFVCAFTVLHVGLAVAPGMSCSDHPANERGKLTPVLIRAWTMPEGSPDKGRDVVYMARYKDHEYRPLVGSRRKYRRLDYFHLYLYSTRQHNPITMFFTRPALVYLFVAPTDAQAAISSGDVPELEGWKSEGFATLVKGSSPLVYGIHDRYEHAVPQTAYVFSKASTGEDNVVETLSSMGIKAAIKNLEIDETAMHFRVAEADGKASPAVGRFQGKKVTPNQRCPDALHDVWSVLDDNEEDEDTRGVRFSTWHPAWDPCFWCAYDHEHGSAAKLLTGYTPKFDYTAWKNNRQNEAHEGFKSFVAKKDDYFIYYNMHAQSSNIGRAMVRFHTIVLAVINGTSGEKLMEVSHKADFGFLAVRDVTKRPTLTLRPEDYALKQELSGSGAKFRAINVVDVDNLNATYRFRDDPLHGAYEEWATRAICTTMKKQGGVKADIERPITGVKSATELSTQVDLGRTYRGRFIRNAGMSRNVRFSFPTTVGAAECRFAGGETPDGYFYTDPDGTRVLPRAGPKAVRQFIKRGFSLTFSFASETADPWLGLYQEGDVGFFKDHGFGIDTNKN